MIQIIDYGAGNLFSLCSALDSIAVPYKIIDSADQFDNNCKTIIAGVGSADKVMQQFRASKLDKAILECNAPVLGICVGMQIMFAEIAEGGCKGLGIIDGKILKLPLGITVPHIGWNAVTFKDNKLFANIKQHSNFYFVHSYYADVTTASSIASSEYNISFCSAINYKNYYGVQFHIEKSGDCGVKILRNFCKLC